MNKLLVLRTFIQGRYLHNFSSREKLEQYQKRKLEQHLKYICEHSPYFRDNKAEDLKSFPLMDKTVMMGNFNRMNTAGIDKEKALNLAIDSEKSRDFSDKLEGYSVGLSSGTSGHRGVFVLSDKEIATWVGGMMARMLPKHKILKNKVAFFLRADNNLYEASNSAVLKFQFFDILKPIETNIARLQEFQPTILVAPPSVLILLADAAKKKKLAIKPSRIISVAEVLTEADKKYFEEVFKQKIHQVYQCTEGFLGYTCEYGHLHLNEDVVHIEKEYLDDKRFVPIITDFVRKTQPIIRYRLNDILVESKEPCECGSVMQRLGKIEGRMDDVFLFQSTNSQGDITVFPDFVSRTVLYVPGIKNYKVVQEAKDAVVVYLDNLDVKTKTKIKAEFKALAKRMEFVLPKISFKKYQADPTRKMKRIERTFR